MFEKRDRFNAIEPFVYEREQPPAPERESFDKALEEQRRAKP
jgi:hypothetical protein